MSNYALRLPESLKQAAKRIAAADDTTCSTKVSFMLTASPNTGIAASINTAHPCVAKYTGEAPMGRA